MSDYVFQIKKSQNSICLHCAHHPVHMTAEDFEALSFLLTPTTSVTTVSIRQEDVQAIVSGLAANPSALAAVALMMQSDGQQAGPSGLPSASSSSSHTGKSPFISGSPH